MRTLAVPLDQEAIDRQDHGNELPSDIIQVALNHDDLMAMWDTPLYDEIKKRLNVEIEIAESVEVAGMEKLLELRAILKKYDGVIHNSVFYTLKSLTEMAIRFNTRVCFYF